MASPTVQTAGTANGGVGSCAPVYPVSVALNELLLLRVSGKYPTNYPTLPAGWTFLAVVSSSANNGPGVDQGSVYTWIAYKVADADDVTASSGGGTVSITATGTNVVLARIERITLSAGKLPSIAVASGTIDIVSAGPSTITFVPDLDFAVDDKIFVSFTGNSDSSGYTTSGQGIARNGSNTGLSVNSAPTAAISTSGDDIACKVFYKTVTSGSGVATASATFTTGASSSTAALCLRIREIDPPARGGVWHGIWSGIWSGNR